MIDWVTALRESAEPPLVVRDGTRRVSVLLVDPRPLLLRSLASVVNEAAEFSVCAEAHSADEALDWTRRSHPDLALVSLEGEADAIALLRRMLAVHPPLRTLVLTRQEQPYFAEAVIQAGARGYGSIDLTAPELLDALRRLAAGEIVLGDRVVERLLFGLSERRTAAHTSSTAVLSSREAQVLELIGLGLSRREIAERLMLSAKTIDIYRERLRGKLYIDSTADLYRFASQWVGSSD